MFIDKFNLFTENWTFLLIRLSSAKLIDRSNSLKTLLAACSVNAPCYIKKNK